MTVSVRSAIDPALLGFDALKEYDHEAFALGTKVQCTDGTIWRFVFTAAAKTVALCYPITKGYIVGAAGITDTTAGGDNFGVPVQTTTPGATNLYFWIQTGGYIPQVSTHGAVAAGAAVYTSATAGKLDDSAGIPILGARWVSTGTAAAGAGIADIFCTGELKTEET